MEKQISVPKMILAVAIALCVVAFLIHIDAAHLTPIR